MGPGRAGMAPTSGPGWVRNTVKQSTWRIWTGPLRMGLGRAQDRTQAKVALKNVEVNTKIGKKNGKKGSENNPKRLRKLLSLSLAVSKFSLALL